MSLILQDPDKHEKSQTNSSWILIQLSARQAQLKRRLAVIYGHGGPAWGWRRSIYQHWRSHGLISMKSPTGRRKGRHICSDPLCLHRRSLFSCLRGDCAVLLLTEVRLISCIFLSPHIITIWWSRLHADSHTSVTHTDCKHAHWTISPRSLTRGCLLLRNEFSWPINYFLPGKALHDDNYDNDTTVIMTW